MTKYKMQAEAYARFAGAVKAVFIMGMSDREAIEHIKLAIIELDEEKNGKS